MSSTDTAKRTILRITIGTLTIVPKTAIRGLTESCTRPGMDRMGFDLAQAAIEELREAGFQPEFGRDVQEQVSEIEGSIAQWRDARSAADLRGMGWSSIDNDTSKDLDQIEVAERVPTGIRVHVAIGDVAAAVDKGSPIDEHAQNQTQTIYTAVKNFPMLPFELSAGMTSLNENEDRLAIMMSFTVTANGELLDETGFAVAGEKSSPIGVLTRGTVA